MPGTRSSSVGERAPGLGKLTLGLGVALVVLVLVFSEDRVASLRAPESLGLQARAELSSSRWQLAALGALLFATGLVLVLRRPRLAQHRSVMRAALVIGCTALPLFLLERGLRPFVDRATGIFSPDDARGWRLVPGASDDWFGLSVRINSQGMRGPERAIPKPSDTRRVLFLGDSVTFGAFIEEERATIPARVEQRLDAALSARVECLNAGVGGYSPWQELEVLQQDAARFEPDLVVLNFVLNDVTEKFNLKRFGGEHEGFQLGLRRESGILGWLRSLALVQYVRRREALRYEALNVYELLLSPNEDRVQTAWKHTMGSLDGIVDWCRERELPLLLVAFPYTLQLSYPERDAPQWILARFSGRRELPYLDLLPALLEELRSAGLGDEALFADALHPNERGCDLIARIIAERILADGLLIGD